MGHIGRVQPAEFELVINLKTAKALGARRAITDGSPFLWRAGSGEGEAMITGAQVRAARALLGWTARSLAKKAIVPEHSLEWIEGAGKITSKDRDTLDALQATLESGGVEFIGSIGVQLKPDGQKRTVRAKRSKGKRKENPRQG